MSLYDPESHNRQPKQCSVAVKGIRFSDTDAYWEDPDEFMEWLSRQDPAIQRALWPPALPVEGEPLVACVATQCARACFDADIKEAGL